ncbi:MAG TPA: molecular chaperone DnaJ [Gemmataceae bacterium]|nr:molecular chaperone DnaJ [Gemmataceae bacterium]
MASKRDYYEVLGIAKDVNPEDLKKAYRTLAMKYHPDRNNGDEVAAVHFKEAAEAYDVLSNPEKRARYDRYGHAGLEGMAMPDFGSGASIFDMFGDILGNIFGDRGRRGPQQGAGLVYTLEVTLSEAYRGCIKTISFPREEICGDCKGSGARPGSRPSQCRQCGGRGAVVMSQGFFRIQQTCPGCGGRGTIITELCGSCKGRSRVQIKRTLQVQVPAGVDNGDRQIPPMQGEGNPGEPGAPRGDLYFDVRVKEHQLFRREGDHLICQVPISFSQAALGGAVEVPTLDGPVQYELKAGHQSHERIHIPGKGMPNRRNGRRGDLVAFLLVETPRQLTKRQEELLRELAEIDKKNVSPERKSFFEKIRGLFTGDASEMGSEAKKT